MFLSGLILMLMLCGCVNEGNPSSASAAKYSTTSSTGSSTTTQSSSSTTISTTSTSSSLSTSSSTTSSTSTTSTTQISVEIKVATDETVYSSHQTMDIEVEVKSELNIGGAALRVYGLERRGYFFLDQKKPIVISSGDNLFEFEYTTPACSACSGLRAGDYYVKAEIEYIGQIIGVGNTSIRIKQ